MGSGGGSLRDPCPPRRAISRIFLAQGKLILPGFHIEAIKDALSCMEGDVDGCPVSVELDEPSAIDGP